MKTRTIPLITLLLTFVALNVVWGQAPPSQKPPNKAGTPQPQEPHFVHLTTSADDGFVLLSTGKSGVDKEAVKAREERDAESNQAVSDGEALLKAGKTQEAIASYKNALAITPTDRLAYQRLAEADMACGKLDEASQNFHKILVEGFGPRFGTGVGGNSDVWANYALVLLKTKHEADALRAYNQGTFGADYEPSQYGGVVAHLTVMLPEVAATPASPDQVQYTPEHLQALADTVLANDEMTIGSNKEAIAHMQEAVKLYPDSAVVQYYLGETLTCRYYVILDSPVKDKKALWAGYEEDKKAMVAAYKKAAELGDDKTVAAAKERLSVLR